MNLAHWLLPFDLAGLGVALVTGSRAERASGPLEALPFLTTLLLSPLSCLASPSVSWSPLLSVSLSLSLSPSPKILGSFFSLSSRFPGSSFLLTLSSSSMATSSATPPGSLGSTSSSGQQPAPCPFSWVPTGHTQARPSPGPSCPLGAPGWRELLMPWHPAQAWPLRPKLSLCRNRRHLVPARMLGTSPADWCCRGHDHGYAALGKRAVALVS